MNQYIRVNETELQANAMGWFFTEEHVYIINI